MELLILSAISIIVVLLLYYLRRPLFRLGRQTSYYFLVLSVVLLVISIVIYPKESVEASYNGLMTWFTIVLPSLLPFFVGAEMLIGLGVVRFIGTLLEPVMRPLFNVPGEGSFAFAMSITSGYPVGVKITSKLRQEGSISRAEAQRMAAFCSTSGPLFILGAVGVGMFHSPQVGIALAICHYIAAILVGLAFRFYKHKEVTCNTKSTDRSYLREALHQLNLSRKRRAPLGVLMGNAVKESINTILVVGGFIIVFSVIIRILQLIGFISFISEGLLFVFKSFNFDIGIFQGLVTGLFEITIGSKIVSEISNTSLLSKLIVTSFIISWSGFSIHAQSFSILNQTDINSSLYLISKLMHGIFSGLLIYILYPLMSTILKFPATATGNYLSFSPIESIFTNFKLSVELFLSITIVLLIISLLLSLLTNIFKK